MKQVFLKANGDPVLIYENNYDTSKYTEIAPPNTLYLPVKYIDGEWIGTPYKEWLAKQEAENKKDEETHSQVSKDEIIANLSVQLLNTQEELATTKENLISTQEDLESVHKIVSNLTLQLIGSDENA
ncbi:hypothetical protein [Staphylococcus caprae]|uniref:hypothetical protein n=1 Tax=Staphylococcus TaxID=1279 RepID=UPI000EB69072|nr:hypothetical protein [Staphylococcus caprae]MDK6296577.1 hypothetical protein [Staphylococcus caprae]MDK7233430.1 hypothetical protein [Staphylococcus caprae]QDW94796.1 hypothetical protein DWB96_11335 [Staphylococcus caprae]QJE25006.1 hypothetical protein HHJ99_04410 [Staphylococcus caprae]BBD90303.1 hypothetical protein JMUB145_1735 [Staphylococcus caprae]